ncbi:hypothetical protein Syun_020602 [Stephania yunnanensis]|uniref:Uncharacterized protein n=1 Tax=Stephania yunnanensis TaxID=152371 RepID=A0AAP0IES6_9MAGN
MTNPPNLNLKKTLLSTQHLPKIVKLLLLLQLSNAKPTTTTIPTIVTATRSILTCHSAPTPPLQSTT